MIKRIFHFLILLGCLPAVPAFAHDAHYAYDLYESDKIEEADAILEPLVEAGDIDAIAVLGLVYFYGIGRGVDNSLAYEYCTMAAEELSPIGLHCLGHIYTNGIPELEIETDDVEASYWWAQAIELGDKESMTHLADNYILGVGVEQDVDEGLRLLNQAADLNEKYALFELGTYHAEGFLVEESEELQLDYWRRSLDSGLNFDDTRLWVGERLIASEDDQAAVAEGLALIDVAADNSHPYAWMRKAKICLDGDLVERDLDCAEEYYEKANEVEIVSSNFGLMAVAIARVFDFSFS